jgi:hypothetical protein
MDNKEFSKELEKRTRKFAYDESSELLTIFTSIGKSG